jgi:sugar phosphate isomerase/epimerase
MVSCFSFSCFRVPLVLFRAIIRNMKIGVRLESMGLPLRRALLEAERLNVGGVQVDAVGDLSPKALGQTGRREFLHLLRSHNLELTALGCPLRYGLDHSDGLEARIEHVKKVMSLSFDLRPRRVVIQAGQVLDDTQDPGWRSLAESLEALGRHGDRVGVVLALETGLEPGATLAKMLEQVDTGGLGVNFDPANFLMNGLDVHESLAALAGRIVHSHAHDARRASANRAVQEVPLGHGDIDWMRYLSELEQFDYGGWIVVKRDSGERRLADIASGVAFLRRLVR